MNKIDFVAFVSVMGANPNGDPLAGNRPRVDSFGRGMITAECIKRKIRNRVMDMAKAAGRHKISVQSNDRALDEHTSIQARVIADCGKPVGDEKSYTQKLCDTYFDVRAFGGTFAWKKGEGDLKGMSRSVRGPVTVWNAKSIDPVMIEDIQITKSTNGSNADAGKASDTMGMRHIVEYGLYRIQGSVNGNLSKDTGFDEGDADVLLKALRNLFHNDASSARPEGTMEVVKLFWFEHNNEGGQYSSAEVFRSVKAEHAEGVYAGSCLEDYVITCDSLPGLAVREFEGA